MILEKNGGRVNWISQHIFLRSAKTYLRMLIQPMPTSPYGT